MSFFVRLYCLLAVITLIPCSVSANTSSTHTTEAVKAAYIYNFLKYIEWPNENSLEAIRVGFLGNDIPYLDALIKIQNKSIRKKPVDVHAIKSHNDASQYQVIVVARDQNTHIGNINRALYGTQTLLISDQADDKRQIMLNFTQLESDSIGYEVNRYNMVNEKLKISSDILILGGTELDIAQLIRDMEKELFSSQTQLQKQSQKLAQIEAEVSKRESQLNKQSNELKRLKDEVTLKENKIKKQSQEISQQSLAIDSQKALLKQQLQEFKTSKAELNSLRNELKDLDNTLNTSKLEIQQSSDALAQKQKEIAEKEQFITQLSKQIEDKQTQLSKQEIKISSQADSLAKQQENLESQNQTLKTQSSTIQAQGKYLAAAIFGLVLVSFLIIIVLSFYRSAKKANAKLATANDQLEQTNNLLVDTQSQLVESEKMAALGNLVAGVAHEINTPLGVSVTAASHLSDSVADFERQYQAGQLKRSELETLLDNAKEASAILSRNLERASNLIGNFKQVATDQTVEDLRQFDLGHYLQELCQSLSPQLKKGSHQITIQCDQAIDMKTYPGALAQVITNLVMNSLLHGFEQKRNGVINISAQYADGMVSMCYKDDGCGINESQRGKIFDPFFTTKRAEGGTGLGMHICYNLITQKMGGTISCEENLYGAEFRISLPTHIQVQS